MLKRIVCNSIAGKNKKVIRLVINRNSSTQGKKPPNLRDYPSRKPGLLPLKPSSSVFTRIVDRAFGKYLWLTNTVSSGLLMYLGDLLQQEIEFQQNVLPERYDMERSWRMTFVGFSQGPVHHIYYMWLSKILPGRTMWVITQKILLDQLVMSPVCIVQFFYTNSFLERKTFKEATNECMEKFLKVYMVDWIVWPPTQFLNFYLIPVRFQVLYINGVTTLYNIFLSYIKHKHRDPIKQQEEKESKYVLP